MISRQRLPSLGALVALLLVHVPAHAGDTAGTSPDAPPGTVAAIPSDTTAAAVRPASASVFRPAPMPGEEQAGWSGAGAGEEANTASLHPEILSMQPAGTADGALTTASSDYDHEDRMHPAGGMGLSIPMQ